MNCFLQQTRSSTGSQRRWLISLFLLVAALPLSATLGGNVASVQADQVHIKGSRRITQAAGYAIHEIQAPRSVIREYVSPAGKIFAVSWEGPGHPDLQQLLGPYFEQFQRAAQMKPARRAPLVVHEPGLVVEIGGVPRHFVGRAYVPQLLPEGVSVEQIR